MHSQIRRGIHLMRWSIPLQVSNPRQVECHAEMPTECGGCGKRSNLSAIMSQTCSLGDRSEYLESQSNKLIRMASKWTNVKCGHGLSEWNTEHVVPPPSGCYACVSDEYQRWPTSFGPNTVFSLSFFLLLDSQVIDWLGTANGWTETFNGITSSLVMNLDSDWAGMVAVQERGGSVVKGEILSFFKNAYASHCRNYDMKSNCL